MPSQTKNSKTKSLKKVSKQPQTALISKGSITKQFANTFKLTALEMETTHELPMIEEEKPKPTVKPIMKIQHKIEEEFHSVIKH